MKAMAEKESGESFAVQTVPRGGQPQIYQGRAKGDGSFTGFTWYNCGAAGHMARFCPDHTQGRATRNGAVATILFPVDGGTQKMIWVDYPPKGLAPGYYPVVENTDNTGARQRVTGNRAWANSDNTAGRITEVKEVTYIDIVSSAAEKMAIGKDLVKYVNAVEDAYVTGRRRRNDTDGGSSNAPPRQRGRVAEPLVGAQRGIRLGEQVHDTQQCNRGSPPRGIRGPSPSLWNHQRRLSKTQ